jgi:hypothetical protein
MSFAVTSLAAAKIINTVHDFCQHPEEPNDIDIKSSYEVEQDVCLKNYRHYTISETFITYTGQLASLLYRTICSI